jgi:uncharacterized cupin superfamily protein
VAAVTDEANLEDGPGGRWPSGPGWFVVNVADGPWFTNEPFGSTCIFESPQAPFEQIGVNIRVLAPGQVTSVYHAEDAQEGALVLSGECVAVVEGEERTLRAWDYLHLPPGTEHVVAGAGEGPAVLLMLGTRPPEEPPGYFRYPVNEVAARYGASAAEDTTVPEEAYAHVERPRPGRPPFDGLPWDAPASPG